MALTSNSTLAEVQAAYEDNADYDLVGSVAKAREFIHACRILLRRYVAQSSSPGHSQALSQNLVEIRTAMQRAQTWLQANGGSGNTGGVRYSSVEEFRQ